MERWSTHGYIPTGGPPSEEYEYFGHRGTARFLTQDGTMSYPPIDRGISVVSSNTNTDDEAKTPNDEIEEAAAVKTISYNIRALDKLEPTYKLEEFEKNYLLVFNQENILGYSKPRLGTEKDVEAIEKTFSKFGFEIEIHKDFTKAEILGALTTCKFPIPV